ncbi:hypothetical protein HA402_012710 [Bradysia odoriphaga]|nr:hypothetical protein HA402_012710 [Bradysia odoriphaga]
MLKQLLLVAIAIGVVYCQECPMFNAVENDVSLFDDLNGEFYKIFAVGATIVDDCQKQKFINGPNELTGYLQSSNWCTRMEKCDTSSSAYYVCDHVPLTSGFASLPSTQRNSIKLVRRIEAGDNLCLIYSYCRVGEEATHLICRKPVPVQLILSLWAQFVSILKEFLGSSLPSGTLKLVKQASCTYSDECFS